jgi:hypothetical protein
VRPEPPQPFGGRRPGPPRVKKTSLADHRLAQGGGGDSWFAFYFPRPNGEREVSTPYPLFPKEGAYNLNMESFLALVLFLVVWFLVLPRIPGISRFT